MPHLSPNTGVELYYERGGRGDERVMQSSRSRLEAIEGAGHAAVVERPETVAGLLKIFLEASE